MFPRTPEEAAVSEVLHVEERHCCRHDAVCDVVYSEPYDKIFEPLCRSAEYSRY